LYITNSAALTAPSSGYILPKPFPISLETIYQTNKIREAWKWTICIFCSIYHFSRATWWSPTKTLFSTIPPPSDHHRRL